MLPWGVEFAGRVDEHTVSSKVLQDNPLGDTAERPLWVYTPPGYDDAAQVRYPSVYVIQGYTGHVAMWRNRSFLRQPFPELADQLFAAGDSPPAIVVFVDAWTSLGGSQYIDSPGTGRYHTYLCEEVVPYVDARYRTLPEGAHRGIQGKSSGGYGAMVSAMLRPDVFGGLATHAGDALFEVCYVPAFREVARALRDDYGGDYAAFFADLRSRIPGTKDTDHPLIEMYAYAAAYSAEPDGTVLMPFDTLTGELVPHVWERWLAWDPVRMAAERAEALRAQRAIWIDAGNRDQYYLDLGAEAFRRAVAAAGVPAEQVHFELFDGTHSSIEYRYPLSLRFLAERLGPA
jgi:S-formylglutathione hydrolase FrmB